MSGQSDFLIAAGWRPAPTVNEDGAWEHTRWSSVPLQVSPPDVFEPGEIRWTQPCAMAITVAVSTHVAPLAQMLAETAGFTFDE